jgi:glutaredoxin
MKYDARSAETSKVYNAVGRCIYCGAGAENRLSREHIVPIGLGGGLVLSKASCESCSKITQKFEEICLRKIFLPYRVYVGLMRHRKELRESIKENGEFLIIPRIFGEPGLICGRPPGNPLVFTYLLYADGQEIDHHVQRLAAGEICFDMAAFARMLAKIAHSYVVAELGLDGVDPELL